MENKGIMLVMGAAPFTIDTVKRVLTQYNRPNNVIAFDDLKKEEGYYAVTLDKNGNNISRLEMGPGNNNDDHLDVVIPSPVIDAPGSINEELKDGLNLLSKDKEWEIYLADHDTALRLAGKLPHVDLAGADFTIDWRLKQMRDSEAPWNSISFRDMEMSDNGEEYLCFYNTETHELFEPDENLLSMPENVVVLEIPYEVKLDPIAVAREYGIGDTDLLIDHPFQMNLKAKVTPLSETGLSKFIEENIKNRDNELPGIEHTHKRGR